MLDLLSATSKEKLAATDLKRFDLDPPALRVTIDGQTFSFGTTNPLSQDQYFAHRRQRLSGIELTTYRWSRAQRTGCSRTACSTRARRPVGFSVQGFQRRAEGWQMDAHPAAVCGQGAAEPGRSQPLGRRLATTPPACVTQPWGGKAGAGHGHVKLADGKTHHLRRRAQRARAGPGPRRREAAVPVLGRDEPAPAATGTGRRTRKVPELPEVETTRRGLAPHLQGQRIRTAHRAQPSIALAGAAQAPAAGRRPAHRRLERRSKYLLLDCGGGWLIVHLGMSGSLRVVPADLPPGDARPCRSRARNGHRVAPARSAPLRRRAVGAGRPEPAQTAAGLGPEPLETEFSADWLYERTRGRTAPIKNVLMDNHLVCGVGNIYANESLFRAEIHPRAPPGASASRATRAWSTRSARR